MSLDFHEKYFKCPMEERYYIYPKPRIELFLNLIENYKVFCPGLTLLYAGLNYDSELKIDYLVIFHTHTDKDGDVILWDSPFLYSNRTVPAYRYAVKNNLHKEFFTECMSHFCQISENKFIEFLESNMCNYLALSPEDPKFWKLSENSHDLMKGMSEMSLQYKPSGYRNPNRPTKFY